MISPSSFLTLPLNPLHNHHTNLISPSSFLFLPHKHQHTIPPKSLCSENTLLIKIINTYIVDKHMGTLVGHVAPGFGFLLIGLWHLFNHIKLHALNPKSYKGPSWFPSAKFRYIELVLVMVGSTASVAVELFIYRPQAHQPLDPDGTIPSTL